MNVISRKYLNILLFLGLMPVFALCQKSDYSKWNLKGKVKSIKESSFTVKEKNGKFEKDSIEYYFLNEFNDFGNKIVDTKYFTNGKVDKNYVYKYDKDNRRIEESMFQNVKLARIITYKYDSKGLLIEDNSVDGNGKFDKTIKYIYDGKGNVAEDDSYNSEGKLLKKFTYKYDAKGNKIETSKFKADGTFDKKTLFSYDSQNNLIEESNYKADNKLAYKYSYSYVYDAQNNWTSKTILSDGKTIGILERELVYYK